VLEVKEWEWEGSARSHDKVDIGDSVYVRVTVWGVMDLPPSLISFSIITNSATVLLSMPREEHTDISNWLNFFKQFITSNFSLPQVPFHPSFFTGVAVGGCRVTFLTHSIRINVQLYHSVLAVMDNSTALSVSYLSLSFLLQFVQGIDRSWFW